MCAVNSCSYATGSQLLRISVSRKVFVRRDIARLVPKSRPIRYRTVPVPYATPLRYGTVRQSGTVLYGTRTVPTSTYRVKPGTYHVPTK
jgi:hypothetical protein